MTVAVDLEPEPPVSERPATSRRRGRRRAAVISALIVVLALLAYVGASAVHPLPATAATLTPAATQPIVTSAVDPAWPAQGSAAVGLVGETGLLGSHGSEASVPIASMTKTITALVLLDKYKLSSGEEGPTVTFSENDVDILHQVWAEDGSWANVEAGEKLSLVQAMTAMMLKSANNYARSLAQWSYGSQDAFVTAANAWLKQHGLTHTHMTDPSGFDPGSVSDLSDLVRIGELAISNPVLAKIVDTPQATLPVVGHIENTDPLIGKDGIEGVKTGFTDQAGHCLLFAAKVTINGTTRTFVGAMLGQPTYEALWSAVPKLLKSYEDAFHLVELSTAGTTVYGSYRTPWGASTQLVAATSSQLEIYSAGTVEVTADPAKLATAPARSRAGTVTFSTGGKRVSAELRTNGALAGPSLWWRISHPRELFAGGWF